MIRFQRESFFIHTAQLNTEEALYFNANIAEDTL